MEPKSRFLTEPVAELPAPQAGDVLPLVSLVIVCYNRKEQLRTTLSKVTRELSYPGDKKEIIVVDNASGDGTAEMVRAEFPDVVLLKEPKNIGAPAWNSGFERARGEYFLILDDDCYMEGDTLLRAVANARGHGADIVSFTIGHPEKPGFSFNRTQNPGMLAFWGCAVLFSRKAAQTLQGYDPGIFLYVNEAEFCMRALDQGFKHLFLPGVWAWHMKPLNLPPSAERKQMPALLRSRGYIAAKRFAAPTCFCILARILLNAVYSGRRDPKYLFELVRIALAAAWRGFKVRAPVSRAVSKAYAGNYWEFTNPLNFVGRRMAEKQAAYYAQRPGFFPLDRATTIQFI